MSHDRGCWQCGRDPWEYDKYTSISCVKKIFTEDTDFPNDLSGPFGLDAPEKEDTMNRTFTPNTNTNKELPAQKVVNDMLRLATFRLGRALSITSPTNGLNELEESMFRQLIAHVQRCFPEETKNYFEKTEIGNSQTTNYRGDLF